MTGRPGPLRAAATLLGLLIAAQVLLGGAGPAMAVASRTPPHSAQIPTASQVQVAIESVSPSMLTRTAILQVKAMITNTGATPLTGVYVRLLYRYDTLATRADLQKWSGGDATLTNDVNEPLPKQRYRKTFASLPPRQPTSITLTVPASALGLTQTPTAFGSRGISVEVGADVPGSRPRRVGVGNSFVIWDPVPAQQPTRLTVLVPVTSTLAQGDASEPTAALIDAMQPTGRLGRLITTVEKENLSWAIDPALLTAAYRAQFPGAVPSPSPTRSTASKTTSAPGTSEPAAAGTRPDSTGLTSTGPSPTTTTPSATTGGPSASGQGGTSAVEPPAAVAARWLNAVSRTNSTNPPQILPFGDPDLAALAHNAGGNLLAIARAQGKATAEQILGSAPRSSIAWPYDGRADDETASMLAGPSWQAIVLAASSQPPSSAPTFTPSGRSTVQRAGTPLQGMLYDEGLSALLGRLGTPGITAAQATQLQQRLLAELATITAERSDEPRHLLITTPRDWDPDPSLMEQLLDAMNQVPWVQLQSTDALLAERPATGLSKNLVYPKRLRARELSPLDVRWARDREQQLEAFSPVLTAPQLVVPGLQRRIVSMVGVAWRGHRDLAAVTARNPLQSQLNALRGAVTVLPGSVANLLSHSGRLPVTVRNQLDQPVRVQLVLKPHSGLLVVGRVKPFTIGANGNHTSVIPVKALGNGEVQVDATLWTTPKAGKQPISQAPLRVRVHSNWETTGLSIAGGVLGLLLVVGLFRSIRRGRKPLPPESAPDPDELLARQESGRRLPPVLHRWSVRTGASGEDAAAGAGAPNVVSAPNTTPTDASRSGRPDPRDAPPPDQPIRRGP